MAGRELTSEPHLLFIVIMSIPEKSYQRRILSENNCGYFLIIC